MLEVLRNNWLFLETGLLIRILESRTSFKNFLDELIRLNVTLVIDAGVQFEFLRSARSNKDRLERETLLRSLVEIAFPMKTDSFVQASQLSNLYCNKNLQYSSQISFQDCLLGTYLIKFKGRLFLATLNHADFPLFMFDRVSIFCVDTQKAIHTIGFYSFNETKYQKALDDFSKSSV